MPTRSLKEAAVEFLTLVVAGKVREAYNRHVGRTVPENAVNETGMF
jgi:hypothetical protein